MTKYERERSFSDRYLPAIKAIVGPMLLEPASFEVDTKQATDLVILTARDIRIAVRVRRADKYLDRYGYEITVREKLDSGVKTEWDKIIDGECAHWFFYGFANPDNDQILHWWLIDLKRMMANCFRHWSKIRTGTQSNGDGTHFRWFDLRTFPDPILIAGSRSLPSLVAA